MDNTKYLDEAIDIIDENDEIIEYDYNGKEDQILIPKEVIVKLLTYVKSVTAKKLDPKYFIKMVVKEAFELTESDLIISKNNAIVIKYIDEESHHEVTEEEKGTVAARYDGFEQEELEEFYKEFFIDVEKKDFLQTIAEDFFDKYFHGLEITNDVYEINVFGYIQTVTLDHLSEMYDNSDGFFHGFAGYLFRIHFKEVFENIADLMLYEISNANTYMIEFLNYYSSSVVVLGGQRYQVPTLDAPNGMRWNVVSMLSIAKVYTKAERDIDDLEHKIIVLNERLNKFYIDGVSPVKKHQYILDQRKEIEQKVIEINGKIDRYLESQYKRKDDSYIKRVKQDVLSLKNKIKEFKKQDEVLASEMVDPRILKAYTTLQQEIDSTLRQLATKKDIIKKNNVAYQSMRNSLVKALTAKKKRIQ